MAVVFLLFLGNFHARRDELGMTFGTTYMSKYISKGKPSYEQRDGFFAILDLDLWNTGFGFLVTRNFWALDNNKDKRQGVICSMCFPPDNNG